jgi:hypothetical protein
MTTMFTATLAALEFNERSEPDADLAEWLTAQNVDLDHALAIVGPLAEHSILLLPRAQFDFAEPLDPDAIRAVVHVALADDATTPADLIAWTRDLPERMLRCLGAADALGIDQLANPASYFKGRALRVHRSALAWLRAGCNGIVPLNYAAVRKRLESLPPHESYRLAADDLASGRMLRRALRPLPPSVRIMVPREDAR